MTTTPLVITISRQLGSGGREIGRKVAEALKIRFVDREIITKAAEELSVLETELDMRDERLLSFWQSFFQFNSLTMDAPIFPDSRITTTGELFKIQSNIIEHVAAEQSAVIMGRCGYYILRNEPARVSVYLHANADFRTSRIADRLNVDEKEARRMLEKTDKERTLYIETFTGNKWSDAHNFDLSIDTGRTGIDKSVELILQYIRLVRPSMSLDGI